MAIGALRNDLVFSFVTENAGQVVVLGLALHEEVEGGVMAGRAHDRRGLGTVIQGQGLVGLVAGAAIALGHVAGVGFMTVHAFRNGPVFVGMTEVAGESRMLARIRNHLLIFFGMTGDTFRFQVTLDRGMDISSAEYRGVPLAWRYRGYSKRGTAINSTILL